MILFFNVFRDVMYAFGLAGQTEEQRIFTQAREFLLEVELEDCLTFLYK